MFDGPECLNAEAINAGQSNREYSVQFVFLFSFVFLLIRFVNAIEILSECQYKFIYGGVNNSFYCLQPNENRNIVIE